MDNLQLYLFGGVPESTLTPEQRQQRHAEEYGKLIKEDKKLVDGIEFLLVTVHLPKLEFLLVTVDANNEDIRTV